MTVKLASALPSDPENNGLDFWYKKLVDNPRDLYMGVVYFEVKQIINDFVKNEKTPVLSINAIELFDTTTQINSRLPGVFQTVKEKRLNKPALFTIQEAQ